MRKSVLFVLSFAIALSCAGKARASESYPATIAAELGAPCPPLCTLCHDSVNGGLGTANRPFGIEVRSRYGLLPGDPQQLLDVLAALETSASDIDRDGTTDVAELRAGTDPNLAGSAPLGCYSSAAAEDEGGCAMSRSVPGDGAGLPASALVAGWLLARRRRRQPVA